MVQSLESKTQDISSLDAEISELCRRTMYAETQVGWDKPMDQLYRLIGGLHIEGIPGTQEEFARYVLCGLQPLLHDRVYYCHQKGFEIPSGLINTLLVLTKMLSCMVLTEVNPEATDAIQRYARGRAVSLLIDPKRSVEEQK